MEQSVKGYERAERIVAMSAFGCKNLPDAETIQNFIPKLHAAAEAAGATVELK